MKIDLRWKAGDMEFGIGRKSLLMALAFAMEVEPGGGGAFLGRFQHLQRLRLVEGINPGRGKLAEYRAHQLLVIALAMQLLQLGLTPERAVKIIRQNQERIRLSISLAVPSLENLAPSFLYFDPALLTQLGSQDDSEDWADQTFHYAGEGTLKEVIHSLLIEGRVPRMAIISVKATIVDIKEALRELDEFASSTVANDPVEGAQSEAAFHASLYRWVKNSEPESLE